MAERFRYGILLLGGTRTHQEGYARAFQADARCRLVAVADEAGVPAEREALNRQLAAELGLPYVDDLNEALALPGVDAASVCVEHERRARVAVRCARARKHLYLDKPIACTVPGARAIAAAVREAGVRCQMFSFSHQLWARSAREALRAGAVGELRAIHAEVMFAKGHAGTAMLGTPRRQESFPRRFTFPDSKRELRATGVYALGLIRWLTGAEVRSVWALTGNYFFAEHQRNGAEDFGLMSLELEGGLTATVTAGRIGWCSHPRGGPMRLTLVGTGGRLTVDAHRPRVEVFCDAPPWTPTAPDPHDPMGFWLGTQRSAGPPRQDWLPWVEGDPVADARAFLDCLDGGREAEVTAADGAALVETLMAAYVSAARGEPVDPAAVDWPPDE
jgi:predicted dehydrogenase